MPTILTIQRHSAESCPMMNEKGRKVILDLAEKMEALAKKHGIKIVGMWTDPWEHLAFTIFESPNLEAWEKLGMEPEITAWNALNTTETKVGYNLQDVVKAVKRAK
jgi:hypothetical protein